MIQYIGIYNKISIVNIFVGTLINQMMNVDLIDIYQKLIEADEAQLGQIPRNIKVYLKRINPFEQYNDVAFKHICGINKIRAESIINMVSQQIAVTNKGRGNSKITHLFKNVLIANSLNTF